MIDKALRARIEEFDKRNKTRLSPNFILRELLYSTEASLLGMSNEPEDWERVVRSGKALCESILEPLTTQFGKLFITFGFQSRQVVEATSPQKSPTSSCPHQWDRLGHGKEIYCRVDILPAAVEDGLVTKKEYGSWIMHHLDADLLMQWSHSNVFCITYRETNARRVWLEWCPKGQGDGGGNSKTFMGEHYWQSEWPNLPTEQRPRFGPSATNGRMWRS